MVVEEANKATEQAERAGHVGRWMAAEKTDLFRLIKARADAMESGDQELIAQNPVENIKRVQANIKVGRDVLKEFEGGVQSAMPGMDDED